MGAAVSRIGTYSDISETVPRQQSPLLQKSCICHRLSFLGATLSTSYRWKLYEPRIVPWNAVARDCCSKKIAKIYLYDPFEIPLLREITATRVSNIQISSSLLLPFSFLLFFFQTHHWEGNRKIFLSLSRINVIIPVDFHSFGGIFGSISPPIIRSSHRENAHQREEWISASRASLPPPSSTRFTFIFPPCQSTRLTRGPGESKPSNVNTDIFERGRRVARRDVSTANKIRRVARSRVLVLSLILASRLESRRFETQPLGQISLRFFSFPPSHYRRVLCR